MNDEVLIAVDPHKASNTAARDQPSIAKLGTLVAS